MNILYFHGLDRPANEQEKQVLTGFGRLMAPEVDYHTDPNFISFLKEVYGTQNIDVIIGFSMGGLVSYSLACVMKKPCLLLNPTLGYASIMEYTVDESVYSPYIRLVIGGKDKVVDPAESLRIVKNKGLVSAFDVELVSDMPHSIGIEDFESQIVKFFKSLEQQPNIIS